MIDLLGPSPPFFCLLLILPLKSLSVSPSIFLSLVPSCFPPLPCSLSLFSLILMYNNLAHQLSFMLLVSHFGTFCFISPPALFCSRGRMCHCDYWGFQKLMMGLHWSVLPHRCCRTPGYHKCRRWFDVLNLFPYNSIWWHFLFFSSVSINEIGSWLEVLQTTNIIWLDIFSRGLSLLKNVTCKDPLTADTKSNGCPLSVPVHQSCRMLTVCIYHRKNRVNFIKVVLIFKEILSMRNSITLNGTVRLMSWAGSDPSALYALCCHHGLGAELGPKG